MKKKIIIVIVALLIIGIGIYFIINSNKSLIGEEKTVHNIKFYNAKIIKRSNEYSFKVKVDPKEDITRVKFDIDIKDKKGKTIVVLTGFINDLKKEDSLELEMNTDKDLKKAYQVSYTVYKE